MSSAAGTGRQLALSSPYLSRMQLRHFILSGPVLPAIGTIAALVWAYFRPIGKLELGLFFFMWLLTGLGASAGYHRLFTHRAYKAATSVRVILAILGSMVGLGPLISWVAYHRRHHELSDEPGDMHSPNMHGTSFIDRVRGLAHAQFAWEIKHEYPNLLHYASDLLRDPVIVRTSSLYERWVLLGLALPALVGGVLTSSWPRCIEWFLVGWGCSHVRRATVVAHTELPFSCRRLTAVLPPRQQPEHRDSRCVHLGRGLAPESSCLSQLGVRRFGVVSIRPVLLADQVAREARPCMGCAQCTSCNASMSPGR